MKSQIIRIVGVVASTLVISFAVHQVSAQSKGSVYTDGKTAMLSAANIQKLAAVKAAVAVPTFLPAGYKVKKVWIQKPEGHIVAFSIRYENAAGKYFTIESNNEALGDMAVKREVKGESSLFKDSAQENGIFHAGHDENDAKTVASEWLCSIQKYQPKGSIPQCFQLLSESKSITPA